VQLDVVDDRRGDVGYRVQTTRSLTPSGRAMWICMIAATTLLIAFAAFLVGAWPVLPFAGIEIVLVATAFHVVGVHDADMERLTVRGDRFEWRRRYGSEQIELTGNVAWARLEFMNVGRQISVGLRYAGKRVELGRGLTTSQRMALAKTVRTVFVGGIA
jgi:uncharacterized membrane protein